MIITNSKLYDTLKWFAQVVLPAIGALYFALSDTWNLPNGEQVVGTIVAVDTFLGVLLHISSQTYKKSDERFDGSINVAEDDTSKTFQLVYDGDPDALDQKDEVTFRINKVEPMKQKVTRARKAAKKVSESRVAE